MLQPIYYTPNQTNPAYQLYYNWTGWPSTGFLPALLKTPGFYDTLAKPWEDDGIRLLEWHWKPDQIQLLISVKPKVTPVFAAARLKGRLSYALRKSGNPLRFQRNFAIRTVGTTRTDLVKQYIQTQVLREPLADPRARKFLQQFSIKDDAVDLSAPTATNSGRYWYNLHLVLVVLERFRFMDHQVLTTLRDGCQELGRRDGHQLSRLAVMPDHLHIALRGNIQHSPQDIALSFMNGLAERVGMLALWPGSYYVGGFTDYDLGAIRYRLSG